ncbi:hypothetical protein ACFX2C_009377 [Malus domestica]
MSSSSRKSDDDTPLLYHQGEFLSKVGYFKAALFKISSDDSFRDFFEAYRHAIWSGVRVKRVKKGHIDGVGQLRFHHRLFDHSSKGDHDWAKETLEISGECESDSSLKLRVSTIFITDSEFGSTSKTSPDMKKVHVTFGIPVEYRE